MYHDAVDKQGQGRPIRSWEIVHKTTLIASSTSRPFVVCKEVFCPERLILSLRNTGKRKIAESPSVFMRFTTKKYSIYCLVVSRLFRSGNLEEDRSR